MKLTLEVLQANDGDCLLLHYGSAGKETRILIDGGSAGVYKKVLKPRLDELRGTGQIDLRMVMVSHIDADHISGIEDLLSDLVDEQEAGNDLPYRIQTLWHNSFEKLTGGKKASVESAVVASSIGGASLKGLDREVAAVVASVKQGNAVRNYATKLGVPINSGAEDDLVRAPKKGIRTVKIVPGLTFKILGPQDKELNKLDESWQKAKAGKKAASAQAADYLNRTVPNLSSIVVLAEADVAKGKKKRMLLTGDAGGDLIQAALASTKISKKGKLHVDLLKVQHHGSNHSIDLEFLQNITADHYVISGNGKHNIPHPNMLEWLAQARKGQKCDVYLTNRKGVLDLRKNLDKFLAGEVKAKSKIQYHFREESALSMAVSLAG